MFVTTCSSPPARLHLLVSTLDSQLVFSPTGVLARQLVSSPLLRPQVTAKEANVTVIYSHEKPVVKCVVA
jgi:hypothetical protein